MYRVGLIVALVLSMITFSEVEAQGTITIGVPPDLYGVVASGVEGWNAAGVGFVVEPSGCGTGDITFCWSDNPYEHGGDASWVAWWPIGTNSIMVSTFSPYPFTPAVVCHELGHWLGLWYHHSDYTSCMADPSPISAYPNDTDLANLGLSWQFSQAETTTQEADVPVVTGLPKTGAKPILGSRP